MLLSAGRLRTKGFEILAIGGIRGNESQATQAGLWQLGGGILGFTGFGSLAQKDMEIERSAVLKIGDDVGQW